MAQPLEVMVIINVPNGYASWSRQMQIERQRAVLSWHDYVLQLNRKNLAPYIWGSHHIIDAVAASEAQAALLVIYRTRSLSEFDELMIKDPLRDMSSYLTLPLQPLSEDIVSDLKRTDHEPGKQDKADGINSLVQSTYRSLFRSPPAYFDRAKLSKLKYPSNPRIDVRHKAGARDPVQLLLYGINPDQLVGSWDDTRRAIHHEKVLWWHAYVDKMTREKRMKYCWSTHDFCSNFIPLGPPSKTAGAVVILEGATINDLNMFYQENPLRDEGKFLSIFLRSIADQRVADELKLRAMSNSSRSGG